MCREQLYVSLFAEVSVAKALLEQIAYVSRGRPEYAAQLLENVRRYVDDDESGDEPAAVTVARVADALLLDDLRKAALDRLVRCVDLASAASLLGAAIPAALMLAFGCAYSCLAASLLSSTCSVNSCARPALPLSTAAVKSALPMP